MPENIVLRVHLGTDDKLVAWLFSYYPPSGYDGDYDGDESELGFLADPELFRPLVAKFLGGQIESATRHLASLPVKHRRELDEAEAKLARLKSMAGQR